MNILILNSQRDNKYLSKLKSILKKIPHDTVTVYKGLVTSKLVRQKKIELIISFHYKYTVPNAVLKIVKFRAINFHSSFLPMNKGMYPVLWAAVFNNFGISLHLMTKKIDKGGLIFRKRIHINSNKSLLFSYNLLERKSLTCFAKIWLSLRNNFEENKRINIIKITSKKGTHNNHFKSKILLSTLRNGWKTKIKEVKKNYKLIQKYYEKKK